MNDIDLMLALDDLEDAVNGLISRARRWQALFWLAFGAAIAGWLR